jgi:hypothetical protein
MANIRSARFEHSLRTYLQGIFTAAGHVIARTSMRLHIQGSQQINGVTELGISNLQASHYPAAAFTPCTALHMNKRYHLAGLHASAGTFTVLHSRCQDSQAIAYQQAVCRQYSEAVIQADQEVKPKYYIQQ